MSWIEEALEEIRNEPPATLSRVPQDVCNEVIANALDTTWNPEDAEEGG